jgi:triacylglycerol lipase
VALVDLQRRLFLTGRRAMIVSTGEGDTGDLRAQARQLAETATQLVEAGAPSVDVVGYSAGGVVARIWLADGGDVLARRVVTIGSPHQGASGAQLDGLVTERYCQVTCPQLKPGSPLLANLPEVDGPAPLINLWTTRDRVVTSPSAHLEGALNVSLQSICPKDRSGHVKMPSDPLAVGLVLKALAPEPLTKAPTKADCADLLKDGTPDVTPGVAPEG